MIRALRLSKSRFHSNTDCPKFARIYLCFHPSQNVNDQRRLLRWLNDEVSGTSKIDISELPRSVIPKHKLKFITSRSFSTLSQRKTIKTISNCDVLLSCSSFSSASLLGVDE